MFFPVQFQILCQGHFKRKLYERENWKTCINLTTQQVITLLTFVLDNSFFTFDGEFYQKYDGGALMSMTQTHALKTNKCKRFMKP